MSITLPNIRQTLHWLGLLVLLLIVVPFVIYAVPGIIGAEGSYVVLSGSMEPSISTGDVVIVDNANPESIEEGDVITYLRSGAETPTTHRVVEITEQDGELAFVTRGDANDQPDASPVPASQLLGVVIFTIPFIGYVIEFVNTPVGFAVLVVVPLLLLVALEVRSIFTGTDSASNEERENPSSSSVESTAPDEGEFDDGVSDDTIALTATDLRLSLGILIGAAVYSGWVAYHIQEPWSLAVVFASCIGALLVGGMYYTAGDGSDDSRSDAGTVNGSLPEPNGAKQGDAAQVIVNGSLKVDLNTSSRVTVDSLDALVSLAASEDEWIIADSEKEGYYLCRDDVIYEFYPETVSGDNKIERSADEVPETELSQAGDNESSGLVIDADTGSRGDEHPSSNGEFHEGKTEENDQADPERDRSEDRTEGNP